jgi:dipeptidyl aminopeptidase/acylaminoacyl peptidase
MPRRLPRSQYLFLLLSLSAVATPLHGQADRGSGVRLMSVDDLINAEAFGLAVPAPEGGWVAVATDPNLCCYERSEGSRLWLISPATGGRVAVGEREFRQHRFTEVVWSPDGRMLAIAARDLSSGKSHLYVAEARDGDVRRISSHPLGYKLIGSDGAEPSNIRWLSDTTLVHLQMADTAFATADGDPETFFRDIAPQVWSIAATGIAPSADVVESGARDLDSGPSVAIQVVSVDILTDSRRVLASVEVAARYRRVFVHLSPDAQWSLVRAADKPELLPGDVLTLASGWREMAGVLELRPGAAIEWIAHDLQPGADIQWMPDGSQVSLTAMPAGDLNHVRWTIELGSSGVHVTRESADPPGDSPSRIEGPPRPPTLQLPPGARVSGDFPAPGVTLFTLATDSGTVAYAGDWRTGRTSLLMELNGFLAGVERGGRMLIEYRGSQGELLNGIALLPPQYEPGKRYPVVVWVYAGQVYRSAGVNSYVLSDQPSSSLNMQVLAAREYVVLFPSIPMPPENEVRDQYLAISPPVLSAVDKLIDLGIADPDRLAVGGHSNGGYTTNVLVTHTSRFKAAITMAGTANLTSAYGTFDVRFRYTPMAARDGTFQMNWAEAGQAGLGAPLTANLWAYVRNSPLFYADRIQTPMLFIHGDQDFVPISEAEQLFSALYRQGKRARFVRYWGEGHQIGASPANTRNLWDEVFAWLDEFLDISRGENGEIRFEGDRPQSSAGHEDG